MVISCLTVEWSSSGLWGTRYAFGSIAHMLTGHAYSRALRANIFTAQAIVSCVLRCIRGRRQAGAAVNVGRSVS